MLSINEARKLLPLAKNVYACMPLWPGGFSVPIVVKKITLRKFFKETTQEFLNAEWDEEKNELYIKLQGELNE